MSKSNVVSSEKVEAKKSTTHHNVVKARQTALEILKAVKAADGEATVEMLSEQGFSRFQIKNLIAKEQIRISGKIETGQRGRPKMKFTVASKGNKRLATIK
jgi:predicted ArsR family transcriptional regulator